MNRSIFSIRVRYTLQLVNVSVSSMQTLINLDEFNMTFGNHFNRNWLIPLTNNPRSVFHGEYAGKKYSAHLVIPNYAAHIDAHYADIVKGDLSGFCRQSEVPFNLIHFGVVIEFSDAIELVLHDDELTMDEGLHQLIEAVGVVIIKNSYMSSKLRKIGHRNRFPHLNFHVDRTANQPTHYSMYARDPFDEEQQHPRTSSTLFIPNIVGHLQGIRDGIVDPLKDKGVRATYRLFENSPVTELMNDLIIEHRWDEPHGVGEISMLDNTTLLHSSYYRNLFEKGYKIGVRYLA